MEVTVLFNSRHLGQGKYAEYPKTAATQGPPKSKWSQD